MLNLLLISSLAFGFICDVTKDTANGEPLGTYDSPIPCSKTGHLGAWGSANAVHTRNTTKEAAQAAKAQTKIDKDAKYIVIKAKCAAASGLEKDICDYLTME